MDWMSCPHVSELRDAFTSQHLSIHESTYDDLGSTGEYRHAQCRFDHDGQWDQGLGFNVS
jgi:hypothetical protein